MPNNILSIFARPKESVMYDTAMYALHSIETLINLNKDERTKVVADKKNFFHRMFQNDKNSPSVLWISDDQYVVFYPAFSKKYNFQPDDKCRFIEVLKGSIFDEKSNKSLSQNSPWFGKELTGEVKYVIQKGQLIQINE